MKKLIGFTAIALLSLQLNAQTSPEIAPPPAPLPPAPTAPTLKTTPVITPTPTIAPVPAPPLVTPVPAPPQPIVTTTAPVNEQPPLGTAVVYNDRGYNLGVVKMKGVDKVYIRNKTTTTYINLSTWSSRQDFYEKKYGTLPSLAPKL